MNKFRLSRIVPDVSPSEKHIVCPICCDSVLELVEGLKLSASNLEGKQVGASKIYRCTRWHVFTVFDQFSIREIQ